jgi:hypothetical protein
MHDLAVQRQSNSGELDSSAKEEVIQTSFRLPRSRWTRLQQLSIEERITVQSIIVSALEKEFEARGKDF